VFSDAKPNFPATLKRGMLSGVCAKGGNVSAAKARQVRKDNGDRSASHGIGEKLGVRPFSLSDRSFGDICKLLEPR